MPFLTASMSLLNLHDDIRLLRLFLPAGEKAADLLHSRAEAKFFSAALCFNSVEV